MTASIYTHIREDTLDGTMHKVAHFGTATGATTGATAKGKKSDFEGVNSDDTENTEQNKNAL